MAKAKQPNVLLIMTDQQRYDATSATSTNGVVQTPHLDQLAADGTHFSRGYINSVVCIPSRASVQTGRYTHQHGVRYTDNLMHETPGLPPWEKTVMEILHSGAYYTGGVGKVDMYPPRGFDETYLTRGKGGRWTVPYGSRYGPSLLGDEYARWLEKKHPGGYEKIYEQRRRPEYKEHRGAIVNALPSDEHVDYWVAEKSIDFINSRGASESEQPFFLASSFTSPHGPFDPPKEYADKYPIDDMPLPALYLNTPEEKRRIGEHDLRRVIAYYYALCTFIDDLVGKMIDALKKQGMYDNTLIIFTSDHGDMLGDLGSGGKGRFHDSVTRVPFIVKAPVISDGSAGVGASVPVVDALVEHIDIVPTILDYAGHRIPETVQGESLRPLIERGEGGKEVVLSEWTRNDQQSHGKCIRTKDYKYVYWSKHVEGGTHGAPELYDLKNDPGELNNLAGEPEYASLEIEMQRQLLDKLLWSERPIMV